MDSPIHLLNNWGQHYFKCYNNPKKHMKGGWVRQVRQWGMATKKLNSNTPHGPLKTHNTSKPILTARCVRKNIPASVIPQAMNYACMKK